MKGKSNKTFLILIILVVLVVGYYAYLSNRAKEDKAEIIASTNVTHVQEMIAQDYTRNYPATPREVVKHYAEITKCFYGETYTDEELEKLGYKIRELYDADLVIKQGNGYIENLKKDVQDMVAAGTVVSGYKVSASTDVKYYTKDGRECAGLYCIFTLRNGTSMQSVEEIFILRKDDDGHWKIFGWDVAPKEDNK